MTSQRQTALNKKNELLKSLWKKYQQTQRHSDTVKSVRALLLY